MTGKIPGQQRFEFSWVDTQPERRDDDLAGTGLQANCVQQTSERSVGGNAKCRTAQLHLDMSVAFVPARLESGNG